MESTSLGLNTICYLFFDPTVIKLQSFFFALQKQYKQISNLTMSQFIFINSAGLITAFCLINLVPQGWVLGLILFLDFVTIHFISIPTLKFIFVTHLIYLCISNSKIVWFAYGVINEKWRKLALYGNSNNLKLNVIHFGEIKISLA